LKEEKHQREGAQEQPADLFLYYQPSTLENNDPIPIQLIINYI
jgi:hypothetical protein